MQESIALASNEHYGLASGDEAGRMSGPPLPTPEVAAAHDAALKEAHFGLIGASNPREQRPGAVLLGRVVLRLENIPKSKEGQMVTLQGLPMHHCKVRPVVGSDEDVSMQQTRDQFKHCRGAAVHPDCAEKPRQGSRTGH